MATINARDKNNIYECISEAVHMEAADDIRAIAIGIIKADGNMRTLTAVAEGGYRLSLVAATNVLNMEALDTLKVERDPGDRFFVTPT